MMVNDDLRTKVREELPQIAEISSRQLKDKVVEAWAMALAGSSFNAIAEIPASSQPGRPELIGCTQADHIRGVARLAIRLADELMEMFPELPIDRDILVAGAICHDVGKPWEYDPQNQARWQASPGKSGWPSIRHPGYGVHICLTVGLPEQVAHTAGGHSGEGELITRSLENTIVHHADCAFWETLETGGMLSPVEGHPKS